MNTNGRIHPAEPTVAGSVSSMARDAVELAELQGQLLMCDLKRSGENARISLVLVALGLCVLLSSIPVALMALAQVFINYVGWPPAAGYGVAALIGILIGAVALGMAYYRFKQ